MKIKNKIPAVVLGMSVNGLAVVRSLAKNGVEVYALDADINRPAMSTRFATCLVCPDAKKKPEELKKFLLNLSEKFGTPAVLFPTSDMHNEFVHQYRDELIPDFMFAIPSSILMKKLLDKKGQYELAKEHCVPIPKTFIPGKNDDISIIAKEIQFPALLKGLNTVIWRERFGDIKAIIVNNEDELIEQYNFLNEHTHVECIIQEIIRGPDTNHYKICAYFDRNSKPLLTFTLQKIRQYPCDFGIGSSVISLWEPDVAALGLKFMQDMKYRGIGSIEFKRDNRDNKLKMIEINPRFWAQNGLADRCGQNFAYTAYLDILGNKLEPQTSFEENIKWIAFKEDRASFYGYFKQGRISVFKWLKSITTGKRMWAVWSINDVKPFLKETKYGFVLLEKVYSKLRASLNSRKYNSGSSNNEEISLELIDDFDKFKSIKYSWNNIHEKTNNSNPFLKHEWLCSWWKGYGKNKKLFIVKFLKDDVVIGYAPLMKYRTKLTGVSTEIIGFISNHWTRMDFLLADDDKPCIDKLAEFLMKTGNTIVLSQIQSDCKNAINLKKFFDVHKIRYVTILKYHAKFAVTGTWDEYFKNQTSHFRMESRRKLRLLQKKGEVSLLRNMINDEDVLKTLKNISSSSWQGQENVNIVMSPQGSDFYSDIINEWKNNNILDVSILYIDKVPVAYIVGLLYKNCYFVFDTAYSSDYRKYSPGLVIHNLLLEELHKDKIEIFDFGYFAEYKNRWTADKESMNDYICFPKGLKGTMFYILQLLKKKFKKGI